MDLLRMFSRVFHLRLHRLTYTAIFVLSYLRKEISFFIEYSGVLTTFYAFRKQIVQKFKVV